MGVVRMKERLTGSTISHSHIPNRRFNQPMVPPTYVPKDVDKPTPAVSARCIPSTAAVQTKVIRCAARWRIYIYCFRTHLAKRSMSFNYSSSNHTYPY